MSALQIRFVVEVNEAAVYSTRMGSEWWSLFRKRFDSTDRITDRNVTPVGGIASVACDDWPHARDLAESMVAEHGLPKSAVKAKRVRGEQK